MRSGEPRWPDPERGDSPAQLGTCTEFNHRVLFHFAHSTKFRHPLPAFHEPIDLSSIPDPVEADMREFRVTPEGLESVREVAVGGDHPEQNRFTGVQ